ncbi:OmpA family protein [Pontibacter locisalis]|uniref:OmpA family protein n=1 Tax=Pontibacter locisalis TaxID=1719035 RepID=A0ABW5IM61_9BACT
MKKNLTLMVLATAGLLISCNEVKEDNVDSAAEVREIASEDTAVMYDEDAMMGGALEADEEEFKEVNFGAPVVQEPELEKEGIETRGDANFNMYIMDDLILFDTDKAEIRPSGEQKLQQMAKAIKEDFSDTTKIRVFGHADYRASIPYNRELSEARAKSVKEWLTTKGGIDGSRISIEPIGENPPVATNETARGRQLNRNAMVVVVAKDRQQ